MKKVFLFSLAFMLLSLTSKAQTTTKRVIGEKFGGGIVFSVSADGMKGLIVETQDQGSCDWNAIKALIAKPETHSELGKLSTDWRLPTKDEATQLYSQKAKLSGFSGIYWTLTNGKGQVYVLDAATGKLNIVAKTASNKVRAVRNF